MEGTRITGRAVSRIRVLLFADTIFSGWLAGATIDRFVVQFPAWRHLDIVTWADYSRHADLGNGLFLYPLEAIGGFLVLSALSLQLYAYRQSSGRLAICVYLATMFAVLGLAFTFFAAPVMLSLKKAANDPVLLQGIFDRFYYFSLFRAIAQVLVFFACVAGLVFYPITSHSSEP